MGRYSKSLGGVISITGIVLGPLLITQLFDVLKAILLLIGLLAGLAITGKNPNQQLIERYS